MLIWRCDWTKRRTRLMHLIALLIILGLLTLLFVAAAYFALSQSPNQPSTHRRYPLWRYYGHWPDKPMPPHKLSFEEKILYRAELDRQLKKHRIDH
jgi:hypothetical protein